MSKPKNMTPDEEAEWLVKTRRLKAESMRRSRITDPKKHSDAVRRWEEKNPDKVKKYSLTSRKRRSADPDKKAKDKAASKKWQMANLPKRLETQRKRRRANPEKAKRQRDEFNAKNPDKLKHYRNSFTSRHPDYWRIKSRGRAEMITDDYVATTLRIPTETLRKIPAMLEAKRSQIKSLRILKTIKQQINENSNDPR